VSKSFDIVTGVVRKRVNTEDKSSMLLVIGEMGCGKSICAVSFACKVDPSFKSDPRIVFDVNEFLEKLNNIEKGQAIIFDEVGVGVAARDFQKLSNKIMSIVTQILRYKNICCIFTTPNARFMDINLRESMNGILHPVKIDREHDINTCEYRILKTNMDGLVSKEKFKFYDGEHGESAELIPVIHVPRPDREMEAYYKKISFAMKSKKLKELMDSINDEAPNPMVLESIRNKADALSLLLVNMKRSHTWDELATACGYSARQLQNWAKEAPVGKAGQRKAKANASK